mmetsp:Transcript_43133/g.102378  ORF Transcript_43133/g.102378 Transcript_43133/m.102378 type:complete len:207 (+) Transcript_43133:975-1595(+)
MVEGAHVETVPGPAVLVGALPDCGLARLRARCAALLQLHLLLQPDPADHREGALDVARVRAGVEQHHVQAARGRGVGPALKLLEDLKRRVHVPRPPVRFDHSADSHRVRAKVLLEAAEQLPCHVHFSQRADRMKRRVHVDEVEIALAGSLPCFINELNDLPRALLSLELRYLFSQGASSRSVSASPLDPLLPSVTDAPPPILQLLP